MSSRLSSLLVQDGLVSAKKVADAMQRQVMHGGALDSNLLEVKAIDEDALWACLGRACGLPTQPTGIAAAGEPLPAILELFTEEVAQRFHAVPATLLPGGVLQVLVTDEIEISDMDTLALTVKQRIEPWVVLEFRFAEALEKVYSRTMPTRFARLLTKSVQAHSGSSKPWPAARLIDPIPRFGSLSDLRLRGNELTGSLPVPVLAPVPTPVQAVPSSPVAAPAPVQVAPSAPVAAPAPIQAVPSAPVAVPTPVKAIPSAPIAVPTPVKAAPSAPVAVPAPVKAAPSAPVAVPAPVQAAASTPASAPGPVQAAPSTPAPTAAPARPTSSYASDFADAGATTVDADPAGGGARFSDGVPKLVDPDPGAYGLEEVSLDEWMSAADWLSAANKVPPPADSTRSPIPNPRAANAASTAVPAQAAPASSGKVEGKPAVALASPVAAPQSQPAVEQPMRLQAPPATAAPSSASPGDGSKRKGKRKGNAPVAAPQQKPAPAQPVQATASKPVVAAPAPQKPVPVAGPVSKPAIAAIPAKPAAAASSKPSIPPVDQPAAAPLAKPPATSAPKSGPPAGQPVAAKPSPVATAAAPSAVSAPQKGTSSAQVKPVSPAQPAPAAGKPLTTPASAAAASAGAPSSQPAAPRPTPAITEAIPEPIDSGRLGERLATSAPKKPDQSAPPAAAPEPPSSESPEPELRPAPRIAVALDDGGASPLSLEASRELIGVASERDAIFEALCRGIRSRAAFAAVFTIHGDVAFGRCALGDIWIDRQTVGRISVPLDHPSAFRVVAKGRAPFIGAIGGEPAAADPLRALDRRPPLPAAIFPILLRSKPVALVYFDDQGRDLPQADALIEELQPLFSEVGQSFQRLVAQSKIGGIGAGDELDEAAPEVVQDGGTSAFRPRPTRAQATASLPDGTFFLASSSISSIPKVEAEVKKAVAAQSVIEQATPPQSAAPQAAEDAPTTRLLLDRPVTSSAPTASAAAAPAAKPAVEEAAPIAPLSALPTVPISKISPAATAEKAEPTAAPRGGGKAGRGGRGSTKSPPTSASTPSPAIAAAASEAGAKGAGAPADVATLLERASAAKADETALEAIWAIGARGLPTLLEQLKDPATTPRVRRAILLCLAEMPTQSALEALGDRLFDTEDDVRAAASAALRNFPPSAGLTALRNRLREALEDSDSKRVLAAVEALGEIGDTHAITQLIDLLDHSDPGILDATGRALQSITKQDFGKSRFRWNGWWRRHQSEPRLQWLLEGLSHPSAIIRSGSQDELLDMSGDVAGYRYDQPSRDREQSARQWVEWWQQHGYDVV